MREIPTGALTAADAETSDRLAIAAAKKAAAANAKTPLTRAQQADADRSNAQAAAFGDLPPLALPVLGFPATWSTIQWNPPVHRATSGAFVAYEDAKGMHTEAREGREGRSSVLGANDVRDRRALKGVLYQHVSHPEEWEIPEDVIQKVSDAGGGDLTKRSKKTKPRYGFRFHYNPSTIDFGISLNGTGLNPALIISRLAESVPITSGEGSPTVRVQFFLNRMEDMTLLARKTIDSDLMAKYRDERDAWEASDGSGKDVARPQRPYPERNVKEADLVYFYGRNLSQEEIEGIHERGTGYDLEFLFRSVLGEPYDTLLRGNTADVGIAFGMPLILDLSVQQDPGGGVAGRGGNRYLGRLSSISYSHLSFDRRMVPIWTQVAMDFMRYPDVNPVGGSATSAAVTAAEAAAAAANKAGRLAAAGTSPNKFGGGMVPPVVSPTPHPGGTSTAGRGGGQTVPQNDDQGLD